MKPPPKDLVASIQARLLQHSRALGVDHQLTLVRFAGERLLYRLAASEYAGKFILKGAALMPLWLGEKIRPTKDIDLLGSGDTSAEELKRVFTALCGQGVVGDARDSRLSGTPSRGRGSVVTAELDTKRAVARLTTGD